MMEACAEKNIPIWVLDRPNPNGYYIDGPLLDIKNKSFVGMHQVPIVHGMTVAEFAQMINNEGWLENKKKCDLHVVKCLGYTHKMRYNLPIKPSPNLPNDRAIQLYPTLGLFEGTVVSCGRGTDFPFQTFGHPEYSPKTFSFKPRSINGASKIPPLLGKDCYGIDLKNNTAYKVIDGRINIGIIILAYKNTKLAQGQSFFKDFFTRLAGTELLQKQIQEGLDEETIRKSWQSGLSKYQLVRKKYLLYQDFE